MQTHKGRILIAEDELRVAQPLKHSLELAGHRVAWVTEMRELREAIHTEKPDVLLLDVSLDTDGLEFFQAIRFAPEHPPGGVVILTEAGDVATRERAQQLGAAAVLVKPIAEEDLVATVEDLLAFV